MTWRQVHRATSAVLLVSLLTLAPGIVANVGGRTTPWALQWDLLAGALLLVVVARLVVCVAAGTDPAWAARGLLAVTAVGLVLVPVLAADGVGTRPPWVTYLVPTATGAAVLAFARWPVAVLAGLAVALLRAAVQSATPWAVPGSVVATDAALAVVVAVACVVPVEVVRASARTAHQARQEARRAHLEADLSEADERENARWDALVHDEVLAALASGAGARTPADWDAAAGHARRALLRLAREPRRAHLPVADLEDRLVHAVGRTDPDAVVVARRQPPTVDVPEAAADAVVGATCEAVRNALVHARDAGGAVAHARVDVDWGPQHLSVVVRDAGQGFSARGLGEGRLGLQVSVRRRMAAVGGSADVRSVPGAGTTVVLHHPAPGREPRRVPGREDLGDGWR